MLARSDFIYRGESSRDSKGFSPIKGSIFYIEQNVNLVWILITITILKIL